MSDIAGIARKVDDYTLRPNQIDPNVPDIVGGPEIEIREFWGYRELLNQEIWDTYTKNRQE